MTRSNFETVYPGSGNQFIRLSVYQFIRLSVYQFISLTVYPGSLWISFPELKTFN